MNSKLFTPGILLIAGMILFAAFIRLIPHPPNFTPVAAMALFGGAYFTKKWMAFLIPILAMILSDIILGFHSGMWAVYLSLILITGIGMTLFSKKKIGNIIFASVISSVLFFVITNFAVWTSGLLYPKSAEGLVACYVAAIPFFHYTLLGDLFFVGVMFGLYHLITNRYPALSKVKV
jgi:hypothetical protein